MDSMSVMAAADRIAHGQQEHDGSCRQDYTRAWKLHTGMRMDNRGVIATVDMTVERDGSCIQDLTWAAQRGGSCSHDRTWAA